ncbi:isopenicillin N synthase family dioxygenase [Azospirillum doebereinerae]|uniref:2-oxoglutarate-dependent ethylene/succinate-forming enzyme n=1 Tax=Azospirillum doebereinerae TaxID=92933 RepID=A0A3S0V8F4_9PROT|nr:2-oxoglutarate and iron-dependent oxygenase domain-containing protein [Azospirillum doebereinerae]MCG5239321.1 isopenicillin N synthase family oxygenase [Azospirillum doebereinerae]RUQ75189.1 isopenicillin N synthase family oxygenase [Azospirillum doebereinerae]
MTADATPALAASQPDAVRKPGRRPGRAGPSSGVPLVDAAALRTGDRTARTALGRRIVAAFEESGGMRVINHGIAPTLADGAFAAARRFFAQPPDRLEALGTNRWGRGFLALRTNRKPGYAPDVREAFDLGLDIPADDPRVLAGKPLHAPNHWPDDPTFRHAVEGYFQAVRDFGAALQDSLALGLGLPEDRFRPLYRTPLSTMRLLHYPNPDGTPAPGEFAMAPHTDFGAYTFLLQDATGGLEHEGADGAWHALDPIDGSLLVFLGDLMAWWSGGRFKALRHRVVGVPGRARVSIPVFYNPDFDAELAWPTAPDGEAAGTRASMACGSYILAQARDRAALLAG